MVQFTQRYNLRTMNTFFRKRTSRKWTWRSSNGDMNIEIDFIFTGNKDIIEDVTVTNKLKFSDHRLMRYRVDLNLNRKKGKLVNKKQPNAIEDRERAEEYIIKIQKKLSSLKDEVDTNEEANDRASSVRAGLSLGVWKSSSDSNRCSRR